MITKEDYQQINTRCVGFVPDGGNVVAASSLQFRKTLDSEEIYHCCAKLKRSEEDIQCLSPQYCGCIADYVAFTDGGYVGVCNRHKKCIVNLR